MEDFCKIIHVFDLEEYPYVGKTDGVKRIFSKRKFKMTNGTDEFCAEMMGDAARNCPSYEPDKWYRLTAHIACRAYPDKNGQTRHSNEIIIDKLV